METIASICAYCGCGCRLLFVIEDGRIVKILPDKTDNPSEGVACIKGLTIHETMSTDEGRILNPLIRDHKDKPFREVPWDEAYRFIYERTKDLAPSEVFINASGRITNEDCYITQKFARIAYKTNNIDACCARLCHVTTVQGLENCFGNRASFSKMDDIYGLDCLFIVGSNPAGNYPVLYNRIMRARRKGLKVVSSSVGSVECEARIDETIPKGRVGMHFHFEALLVNKLFATQFDEKTFTPNYKMVAVCVRKINPT